MLQFLGRGCAFADDNNCAFFRYRDELVLLDCPMTAFHAVKHSDLTEGAARIRIFVTHTHSDHISGIPLLIHYVFYLLHPRPEIIICAPSEEVRRDLAYLIERIEGCRPESYTLELAEDAPFAAEAIPTEHVPTLEGRCFGYHLQIDGQDIVYTGDTCTLEPFLPYLHEGTALYTEASCSGSPVHLSLEQALPELRELENQGVRIFLMHLDDEEQTEKTIRGTGISLAPLYRSGAETQNDSEILSEIFARADKLYRLTCNNEESDHSSIFAELTELGRVLTNADRASFWKWDKRRHELWTLSATGTERIVIPETTGLVSKALREQRVIVTNDPYSDPDFNQAVDKQTGYVTKSVLVLPVADVNGNFIGAYQLINKPDGFHAQEDARRLSFAALICGMALESDTFLEESQHDRLTKLKNRMGF